MLFTVLLTVNFAFANDLNDTNILTEETTRILTDNSPYQNNTFDHIQKSIDGASNGDTIYLNGTTYYGNGTQIKINKSITIIGSGENDALNSTLDARNLSRILYIEKGYNVILKNIIFEKAMLNANGAVIYCNGGNLTLTGVVIQNLNLSRTNRVDGGVIYSKYSNFTMDRFIFRNNFISSNYLYFGSIHIAYSKSKISNVDIYDNMVTCKNQFRGTIFTVDEGSFALENYTAHNNTYISYYRFFMGSDLYAETSELNLTNLYIYNNTVGNPNSRNLNIESDGLSICIFSKSKLVMKNATYANNTYYHSSIKVKATSAIVFGNINLDYDISCINVQKNYYLYPDYLKDVNPYDKSTIYLRAFFSLNGAGSIVNSTFHDNYVDSGIGILQLVPNSKEKTVIVDNCNFTNNYVASSELNSNRTYFADHGAAICVSGGRNGSAIIRNCNFINNTNSQGGAITPHNHCLIENCKFINNTATKFYGGAISTENGLDMNNANITIRDCYFEDNAAPIGGAIQAKGDYIKIDNCTFKDNNALQGGGVFLEGNNLSIINSKFFDNNATHDLSLRGVLTEYQDYLIQVTEWTAYGGAVYIHGNNAKLSNNTFIYNSAIHDKDKQVEGKGGAIYIYGDNATAYDCYFDDNFAQSGNGSAIYVLGENATVEKCELYNHDAERGTVFIRGSHVSVLNSTFKNNTASRGGAGIYIVGNNTLIDNNTFEKNNATVHGGAIYSHGYHVKVLNSKFIYNNAHPDDSDLEQGLGGAIYTKGDYNDIAYCEFNFNTARNGSAIYNTGSNLTIEDCNFHYNQAYSYNLFVTASPKVSDYVKNNNISINITHIGGDNIINAIYNDGDYKNIFFYNVTYEHSSMEGGKRNSGYVKINPVASAELSENGKLIYQDSREDLQIIDLIISREDDSALLSATVLGDVVKQYTGRTGLYGNLSYNLIGDLKPGKYNVYASHPDDMLYKAIENSTTFEISPQVDLNISKSSDRDTYFVGETATYTININSLGTDAHNVSVKEILPNSFIVLNAVTSKGTFANNIWSIPLLEQESNATLTITVKLTTNGTFINIVNVTSSDDDLNLSNNVANNTINVKPLIDLKVNKTVDAHEVKVGDYVIWTITVKNNGLSNATDVKVDDVLPNGLKYINHDGDGIYSSGIWNIGNLKVNESAILIITTQVIKTGEITNIAKVRANETENNTEDNEDNDTVKVKPYVDLKLTKRVNVNEVKAGDTVVWTITVKNNGLSNATQVKVDDVLPNGLKYISHDGDGTYSSDGWNIGVLNSNETVTLKITTQVTKAGNITNIAESTSYEEDYNETDNIDNDTVHVKPYVDLKLTKTVNIKNVNAGDTVVWTITVKNNGFSNATGVKVDDVLPIGLKYLSHDGDGRYFAGLWEIGDLNKNETATLKITTQVTKADNITNVANVSSDDEDYNKTDNIDNDTVHVKPYVDLKVTKTVSVGTAKVSDRIVWTIVVKNNGFSNATGVKVTDNLVFGLKDLVDNPSKGVYDHDSGMWDVGDLNCNESATLKITTLLIKAGNYTNVANASSDDEDFNESDNVDNATVNVTGYVDLNVNKTVNIKTVKLSDIVIWTIVVKNNGLSNATGVNVTDKLPDGLKYLSHDGFGRYDSQAGLWFIGDLDANQLVSLKIITQAVKEGNITNVASATSDEVDFNTTDDADNDTVNVKPYVDLKITKTVNIKEVNVGDSVIWTIVVKNNGFSNATGVKVTDNLPSGLIYLTHSVTKGQFDGSVWNVENLSVNETAILQITTKVINPGYITNTVNVISDINDTNNTDNFDDSTIKCSETNDNQTHDDENSSEDKDVVTSVLSRQNQTGNPILMVLLALISLVCLRRKF